MGPKVNNGESLYREQVQALPEAQPGPVVRDLKARGYFGEVDSDLDDLPTYLEASRIWVPRHKDWESNPAGTPHVHWVRGLAYRVRWEPAPLPAGFVTAPGTAPPRNDGAVEGAVSAINLASLFYGAGYKSREMPPRPPGSTEEAWRDLQVLYAQGREDAQAGRPPRYTLYAEPGVPQGGILQQPLPLPPLPPPGPGLQQQDPLSMLLLLQMMGGMGGEEPRRKKKKKVKYVYVPSSAPAGYPGNGGYAPGAAPQGKK